ncbi:MAG: hypothetical protein RL235_612 [Chlamydiota bacterium]|jgi:outer membrane assembly lipoprotein YfiO
MPRFALIVVFFFTPLFALEEEALVWEDAGPTAQEYNSYLLQAIKDEQWWAVIDYADIISYHFPTSPFAQDTSYLMGEAYFKLGQLELANECFSAYLHNMTSLRHFNQAIEYKFAIAEQFYSGTRKPLFGSHKLPKIVSAKEDALKIYEEVIATMPNGELAAKSLINKARLETEFEDYKPALETLDVLIRRFPKHDLAAEAYLEKMKVYAKQCEGQDLDPDLLDLAEVNLTKFRLAFPREPRLGDAETVQRTMKERFAENLLTTGKFFEKTKKLPASLLYYKKVVSQFPDTEAAKEAQSACERIEPRDAR